MMKDDEVKIVTTELRMDVIFSKDNDIVALGFRQERCRCKDCATDVDIIIAASALENLMETLKQGIPLPAAAQAVCSQYNQNKRTMRCKAELAAEQNEAHHSTVEPIHPAEPGHTG